MQIIRSHNTPNRVTLFDGTVIERDKLGRLWVPEWGIYINCALYDNHFIFEVPARIKGTSWLCSCGSPAYTVGMRAYAHLSDHKNAMLVCHQHTSTNKHSDGSS